MSTMADEKNEKGSVVAMEEQPFSPRVMNLYQRIQKSSNRRERTSLMMEFAAVICAEHDKTDHTAVDDYHAYMEKYEQAKLAYEQASFQVARMMMDCIETFLEATDTPLDAMVHSVPPRGSMN